MDVLVGLLTPNHLKSVITNKDKYTLHSGPYLKGTFSHCYINLTGTATSTKPV